MIVVWFKEYLNDSQYLEKVLIDGSQKASEIATKNLEEIYDIVGLKKFTWNSVFNLYNIYKC